jgi:hypothetical protein
MVRQREGIGQRSVEEFLLTSLVSRHNDKHRSDVVSRLPNSKMGVC